MRVFGCCDQVIVESDEDERTDQRDVKRAA
jgi:hypothetical protein